MDLEEEMSLKSHFNNNESKEEFLSSSSRDEYCEEAKSFRCCNMKISRGRIAQHAAVRLRTAAEVLESTDNISVIVIIL
ncbi:MAG: hypothetical protein EZS28_012605 [Streblomastix strix]|uniref:Uncharacterized protein n=1 Tax=Streblomastix strix TaxID=222440 RepID=A0A5J4WBX1_9EUKA|nr:MAG: hypothetical protein EZS28_012605 [Streblomastix strix]